MQREENKNLADQDEEFFSAQDSIFKDIGKLNRDKKFAGLKFLVSDEPNPTEPLLMDHLTPNFLIPSQSVGPLASLAPPLDVVRIPQKLPIPALLSFASDNRSLKKRSHLRHKESEESPSKLRIS